MDKCLETKPNNDTQIIERICLIINNCVLLTDHYNKYNFPGGRVKGDFIDKPMGLTSFEELHEELGIKIKPHCIKRIMLLSWFLDKHTSCYNILVCLKISFEDIEFVKGTHVWETGKFTLYPLSTKCENISSLGFYIQNKIRKANTPCSNYVQYGEKKLNLVTNVKKQNGNIWREKGKIYIKLIPNPDLTSAEKDILKKVNEKITGFYDDKHIYTSDRLCKYIFLPFTKRVRISVHFKYYKTFEILKKEKWGFVPKKNCIDTLNIISQIEKKGNIDDLLEIDAQLPGEELMTVLYNIRTNC